MNVNSFVTNISSAISRRVTSSISSDLARMSGVPQRGGVGQAILRYFIGGQTLQDSRSRILGQQAGQREESKQRLVSARQNMQRKSLQFTSANKEVEDEAASPTGKNLAELVATRDRYLKEMGEAADALAMEVGMHEKLTESLRSSLLRQSPKKQSWSDWWHGKPQEGAVTPHEEAQLQSSTGRRDAADVQRTIARQKLQLARQFHRSAQGEEINADLERLSAFRAHRAAPDADSLARKNAARAAYRAARENTESIAESVKEYETALEKAAKALDHETLLHDELSDTIRRRVAMHASRDKTIASNRGLVGGLRRSARVGWRGLKRGVKRIRAAKGVRGKVGAGIASIGPLQKSAMSAFGSISRIAGVIGRVLGPAVKIVTAMNTLPFAVKSLAGRQVEQNRELSPFSMQLHRAQGQYDLQSRQIEIQRARETGESAAKLVESQMKLREAMLKLEIPLTVMSNKMLTQAAEGASFLGNVNANFWNNIAWGLTGMEPFPQEKGRGDPANAKDVAKKNADANTGRRMLEDAMKANEARMKDKATPPIRPLR